MEPSVKISQLRKTLLATFLVASVGLMIGSAWLPRVLRPEKIHLPAMLGGGTTADVTVPAGGGDLGVAAAAEERHDVAPNTRTFQELRIPALGISAGVQDLGLTADGRMGSPSNHYEVGWFKYGTKPGDRGNAVIAGHVNTLRSSEGIFKNLYLLKTGDTVEITDADGRTYRFTVTGTKTIPYDDPAPEVFGPTTKRRLNLVTCAGSWIKEKRTYTERLVVFTELVE